MRLWGAGRFRPLRRPDDRPGLPQLIAELYEVARLSSRQIAAITGLPERTIRDRLRRYGIRVRSRGGWNREDRRTVPAVTLRDLYEQLGMTADEIGELIGTSRSTVLRSAHALGVPVRTGGGAVPLSGPEEIELVKRYMRTTSSPRSWTPTTSSASRPAARSGNDSPNQFR